MFKAGLGVMSNAYSSPRVLVLQQKKMPAALMDERRTVSGGGKRLPADRLDLIPYAGQDCRSGWCTSETACTMLMTEGGGHAYELGVGRVPVTRGHLPSLRTMRALFRHESTRFVGKGDKRMVQQQLAELEWRMKTAMEQAEQALQANVLSVDPRLSKHVSAKGMLRV